MLNAICLPDEPIPPAHHLPGEKPRNNLLNRRVSIAMTSVRQGSPRSHRASTSFKHTTVNALPAECVNESETPGVEFSIARQAPEGRLSGWSAG